MVQDSKQTQSYEILDKILSQQDHTQKNTLTTLLELCHTSTSTMRFVFLFAIAAAPRAA